MISTFFHNLFPTFHWLSYFQQMFTDNAQLDKNLCVFSPILVNFASFSQKHDSATHVWFIDSMKKNADIFDNNILRQLWVISHIYI